MLHRELRELKNCEKHCLSTYNVRGTVYDTKSTNDC